MPSESGPGRCGHGEVDLGLRGCDGLRVKGQALSASLCFRPWPVFSFATWDGGGGQVPHNPCLRSAFMFPDSQTHTNTHPDRVEFRAFCQGPGVLEKCKAPCGRCQGGAPCRKSLSAKVPQKRMSRWESKGDRSGLGRILLPSPVYSSLKEVEEKAHKNGETPTA